MASFQFKKFVIEQNLSAMKVGTDGVLLGAWSSINEEHILDIGTGTGLIAIMIAQRSKTAHIDAIEINASAAKEAQLNIDNSDWSSRVTVLNVASQNFRPKKKYDTIISNPPFFVNSTKAAELNRNSARHTDTLSYDELINTVVRLLKSDGIFSAILPTNEGEELIRIANANDLYLTRKCIVKPNPTKPSKRVLLEFSFAAKELTIEELTIETETRHHYTKDYISLTKDFYLNF